MSNPYKYLPAKSYWRSGVAERDPFSPNEIYRKKWDIFPDDIIGTAGSCFAQHITRNLKTSGFKILDVEPPPPYLPPEKYREYQYNMYSARYGNIYTSRQLLQLAQEAFCIGSQEPLIWERSGRYFDALRPGVERLGLSSYDEVIEHREYHVSKVRELFSSMDILIFTLGLTETWIDLATGRALPVAPGVIAGKFDPEKTRFVNLTFSDVRNDLLEFAALIEKNRSKSKPLKFILTVSPVPLTATASGTHVLPAANYSKAVLRAVAGELSTSTDEFDYFPSYEIITNPVARSIFYENNIREVRQHGVDIVMGAFFREHALNSTSTDSSGIQYSNIGRMDIETAIACEEAAYDSSRQERA